MLVRMVDAVSIRCSMFSACCSPAVACGSQDRNVELLATQEMTEWVKWLVTHLQDYAKGSISKCGRVLSEVLVRL